MGGVSIDWRHPVMQQVLSRVVDRALTRVLPPDQPSDPTLRYLERMSSVLEQFIQSGGPGRQQAPVQAKAPYSRYLAQEGASSEWDTGCLHCGRAHIAAARAMIQRAHELAQQQGPDAPEVRGLIDEANRELTGLLELDWTPERVAASPPDHRAVIERYLPQVRQLQQALTGAGAAEVVSAWSLLDEAGRFAREDGIEHPEVRQRLSRVEELTTLAERSAFAPDRMATMPPQQQAVVRDALPKLRRLRQYIFDHVHTPEQLDTATAEFAQLARQLSSVSADAITPERLEQIAAQASAVRQGFADDVTHLAQPVARAADLAAAVVSGKMSAEQAAQEIQEGGEPDEVRQLRPGPASTRAGNERGGVS